jgi:hypothetical protein
MPDKNACHRPVPEVARRRQPLPLESTEDEVIVKTVKNAPQRLGRYRIDGVLGEGALGIVYRAFDPHGQRTVAIKALRPEVAGTALGARLRDQGRAVARLSHPGIVAIHEVEESDGAAFVVMEHVAGLNLAQWLATTPLPHQNVILQVMDQLLDALDFAHHAGVRHGGVKPANVLVTATGVVKLTDFGVARLEGGAAVPGVLHGLLAPEIALGRPIDNGVDIFAAGVLLYRMLTGRDPAVGATDGATPAAPIGAPRAPSTFLEARRAPAFDAIVARAMAREPGDRYQSAEAFREALRSALDQPMPVHGSGQRRTRGAAAAAAPQSPPGRLRGGCARGRQVEGRRRLRLEAAPERRRRGRSAGADHRHPGRRALDAGLRPMGRPDAGPRARGRAARERALRWTSSSTSTPTPSRASCRWTRKPIASSSSAPTRPIAPPSARRVRASPRLRRSPMRRRPATWCRPRRGRPARRPRPRRARSLRPSR